MNLTDIFLKLLNMSFTGAVAIAVVLLVRLLFKKLPKKYTCILWVVVLVRLLCPFTIPTLVIGQPDIPEPIPGNIMEVQNPSIWSEIEVIDNSVNRVLEQNFTPEVGASVNPLQIAMAVGTGIWIAGMVVMLFYTAWNLYRFRQWTGEAVTDKDLGERVYRCEAITPVVTGIVNPKIYLPFSLKEPGLSHVLMHENMHIRRKDHILKVLFYIAVAVHWFNPFVWLAYRLLERDMEMACDEAVIGKLGNEEKKNYCESLLELASSKNHFVGNPVAFGESDVKVRMKNLLNYKKPVFWVSAAVVAVIIVVAISCLSSPKGNKIQETSVTAEITDITYPLTKEVVEPIFAQVDLPGMVTEEEYDSAIRTSIDIRDEENRLMMGINSTADGDKRFLGITLVPYLHSGAATAYLPEEKWEDIITFATLLYGFENQSMVYHDFIESYEISSIHTEYQHEEEPYYKHRYEWIRSYGDVTCVIDVCVATDGTKDIQTIGFYNSPEYSATNSEMAAKNFMYNLLTSIPGRYAAYLESGDDFPYLNRVADKATEKCLQSMEEQGYYTLVDEYAEQAGVQIRFVNAALTEVVNGDKDVADYLYTATLTKEKDGETKEFTVEGEICVVNMLNGWKVDNFKINDTEALHRYITKESLYPQGYEPSGHKTEQLTMDIFLEAVERKQIKSVLWDNFENKQQDNFDTAALNYYVSYHLDYEGKEIRLDFSYNKESQQLENIYLYSKDDESLIWIYDAEDESLRMTREEIVTFIKTDHSILNEIYFELPVGINIDSYNADVGYEGGCLLLPMVYEGDEQFTPSGWMASGVVSRYTQSAVLEWKDGSIENIYPYYNHTYREIVEKVEGLCAPALLVNVGHDLYTIPQLDEMKESGVDTESKETISKYWYLFIAEPGEEYGYVITLNQKNFTKEDILALGKTVQLLK